MNEIRSGNIDVEQIIVTKNGLPRCSNCGDELAWEIKNCGSCGTPFGAVKRDEDEGDDEQEEELNDVRQPEDPNGGVRQPEDPNGGVRGNRQDIQCEVCEWWNPGGTVQCMQCTAFLPEEVF